MCGTHVRKVEMRDLSTTHGIAITHFCVARRQGVNIGIQHAAAGWLDNGLLESFNTLNKSQQRYKPTTKIVLVLPFS